MTEAELQTATGNAQSIVDAFNEKAREIVAANPGCTLAHAREVMLGYLSQTDPEAAKTIRLALVVA